LFLDEIGDMALPVQAKLLRFIQDKDFERLGDSVSRKADVRILAATNADLEQRVAEGRFREDLFYRLNVISLTIPPLRDRQEDIMPMAKDFLAYFCKANHKNLLGFTTEAEGLLSAHAWPGNVRELRNAIERAVILGSEEKIGAGDLPGNTTPVLSAPAIGDKVSLSIIEELHIRRILASTPSLQEAADVLGIDQATLWRRRKTYGI
jgi:NtrC-family two-component system response regulator AlgB